MTYTPPSSSPTKPSSRPHVEFTARPATASSQSPTRVAIPATASAPSPTRVARALDTLDRPGVIALMRLAGIVSIALALIALATAIRKPRFEYDRIGRIFDDRNGVYKD